VTAASERLRRIQPKLADHDSKEARASLDGPADTDAQRAWEAEISRRIAAIESGAMTLESWDEMKRRVAKDVLGR